MENGLLMVEVVMVGGVVEVEVVEVEVVEVFFDGNVETFVVVKEAVGVVEMSVNE